MNFSIHSDIVQPSRTHLNVLLRKRECMIVQSNSDKTACCGVRNLRSSRPNFDGSISKKPCDESDTTDKCPGTNQIAFRHNELSHLPALLCAARYLQRVVIEWPFELDRFRFPYHTAGNSNVRSNECVLSNSAGTILCTWHSGIGVSHSCRLGTAAGRSPQTSTAILFAQKRVSLISGLIAVLPHATDQPSF